MSKEQMDSLIEKMSKCTKCINLKTKKCDYSLINFYQNQDFSKNIPSIWTDWYNRLDANIMIVGQDWGPYEDMKKLNQQYLQEKTKENWQTLIESEKSLTKKQLEKYMITSSNGRMNNLDNCYITNAIMCARNGHNYRGNNINLNKSTHYCQEFLKSQIEIVKPKVVVTLGYYPLKSLSEIYCFSIEKNLKDTITKTSVIQEDGFVIIPLYHPVAQIKQEEQLKQYKKIWEYI